MPDFIGMYLTGDDRTGFGSDERRDKVLRNVLITVILLLVILIVVLYVFVMK